MRGSSRGTGANGSRSLRKRSLLDLAVGVTFTAFVYLMASLFDVFERVEPVLRGHEWMQADELPLVAIAAICSAAWFAYRRRREASDELRARRATEQMLSAARTELQRVIAASPGVLYTCEPYGEYRPTYVSDSISQLGFSPREFVESPTLWADLIHPDDRARVFSALSGLAARGQWLGEYRLRNKDGAVRWMHDHARLVRDGAGQPAEVVGYMVDVTDHVQMRAALQASEQRYRILFESLDAAVLLMDGLRCIDCNPATLRLFGVGSREEFIGSTPLDFAPPCQPDGRDSAQVVRDVLATTLEKGVCNFEWQAIKPTGERFLMEVRFAPLSVGTDQLFQCIAFDVTERKRLELALGEAQASLELATTRAKVSVWHTDLRTLVIRFSAGWKELLGRDERERSLASLWDLVHPDDRAQATLAMQEHLQGRVPAYESTHRMLHADGSYRWVLSRGMVACDIDGRPSHVLGADIDVTERTALEEALRRSEGKYRHLVEDITDVIYEADPDGRVTYISPAAERLYGYAPRDVINRPFSDFILPDDLGVVAEGLREALSGQPRPHDHRVVIKSGEIRWVRNLARPILENDHVVGLRGVMTDVTERRRVEDALRNLSASLEQQVAERTRELAMAHQRLRLITDNVSDLVSQVTLEGRFEYVSPAHERVLGYTPQQMIGRSVLDFLHPDDLERVAAIIDDTINDSARRSASRQIEFRYRHADSHYVWLETAGQLLFDERQAAVGAVLSGRDVSDRKRAEETLRESEERFRAIFERAPLGVALIDSRSGRFLRVNQKYCEIVGRTEPEMLATDFQSLTYPDDLQANLDALGRLLRGESRSYTLEKRYRRPNGETVWANVTAVPMWAEGMAPTFHLAMVEEITARKQAEERLERLRAELEERVAERTADLQAVNKELEAFSYSVSHDLRAPLRAIDGFSRMLREEYGSQLPAEGVHCVERVCAAVDRMAQLIDDLLKLSRVQRSEVARTRVDLSALARAIAAELRRAAPARTVDWVIADGVVVAGDVNLLRVALENLLGNAWKYTGKHATARIEFGVAEDHGRAVYFVRDDGAGFDMAYADKLFGAFKRLHGAQEFEGTGIGLAIVQRIIRRHGGEVWAEAEVDRGATFYFTLPAAERSGWTSP